MVERGEASHGTVVLAVRQTHGRGTGGKRWVSDAPMGVWCTVVLMGDVPEPISLVVGVAAVDAIRSVGCDAHLKWPNDVLIGRKKVAGILVETASAPVSHRSAYLVGIGINVMQESFDGELAGRATSLRMEMKDPSPTIAAVFGALVRSIEDHQSSDEPVTRRWIARTRMIDTEAEIRRKGASERVMVRGLTPEGRLVVESGEWKVESGDSEGMGTGGRRRSIAAASDMDLVWPVG